MVIFPYDYNIFERDFTHYKTKYLIKIKKTNASFPVRNKWYPYPLLPLAKDDHTMYIRYERNAELERKID